MLRRVPSSRRSQSEMSYEEIKPRALKPSLLELDGISRATIEAHYRLYQGYVAKRNEILGRLSEVGVGRANHGSPDPRALKNRPTVPGRPGRGPPFSSLPGWPVVAGRGRPTTGTRAASSTTWATRRTRSPSGT